MDNSLKIWRVNVRDQSLAIEPVPERWKHLGGRGILACILTDEVDPTCDPLGQSNKLVFAPGLFTGHMLSSIDRISVGAKSPLTGGIKESNAGGRSGLLSGLQPGSGGAGGKRLREDHAGEGHPAIAAEECGDLPRAGESGRAGRDAVGG